MSRLNDPMGLILAAARVDPVLMKAARQVQDELDTLRAQIDYFRTAERFETWAYADGSEIGDYAWMSSDDAFGCTDYDEPTEVHQSRWVLEQRISHWYGVEHELEDDDAAAGAVVESPQP